MAVPMPCSRSRFGCDSYARGLRFNEFDKLQSKLTPSYSLEIRDESRVWGGAMGRRRG